jgi:hypothetical protein
VNKQQALTAVRDTLGQARSAELARLEPIRRALDPRTPPSVEMPKNPLPSMTNLAGKSRTNFLPLVLDTYSQVMKVDGFTPTTTRPAGGATGSGTGSTRYRPACTVPRSPTARRTW